MTIGDGIRVPGWAVTAVVAAAAILGAGIAYGKAEEAKNQRDQVVDYRLCRIERALNIQPWQSCYSPATETAQRRAP